MCARLLNPALSSYPAPRWNAGTSRVRMVWQHGGGGGLSIEGTATLTDTNVYENQADVCSPVESCLELSCSAWLERHVCSCGWQDGGGLYISYGTATLTDTSVYENQAYFVCARLLNLP